MQVLLPAIQAVMRWYRAMCWPCECGMDAAYDWQIRTAFEYNYDRTWNNAYAGGLYDLSCFVSKL